MDRSVFKSLKTNWRERIRRYTADSGCRTPNRATFLSLVHEPYLLSISPMNIQNGFKRCGLYPFNPKAILDDYLKASTATERVEDSDQVTEAADATSPTSTKSLDVNTALEDGTTTASISLEELVSVIEGPAEETSGPSNECATTADNDYIANVLKAPHVHRTEKVQKRRLTPSSVCLTMILDKKDEEWHAYQESKKRKGTTKEQKDTKSSTAKRVAQEHNSEEEPTQKKKRRSNKKTSLSSTPSTSASKSANERCSRCEVAYTELDLGDWIECLTCKRWFHMICEGVDELEAPTFICSDCFC